MSDGLYGMPMDGDFATLPNDLTKSFGLQSVANGRLTLTSLTPVTTSDVTGATTVYYTPYNGNRLGLWTGSQWRVYVFSEMSLALGTITSGANYDVFAVANGDQIRLELGTAWSSDTARAAAISLKDGVYVQTTEPRRRYLGTFRTTATTTTEDSKTKRFLWNVNNRVRRNMSLIEGTDFWTYTTAAWRAANNSTANRFEVVRGLDEDAASATVVVTVNTSATITVGPGIGLDSTTANSAQIYGGFCVNGAFSQLQSDYRGCPGPGYHYLQWIEYSTASGSTTWYGDNGSAFWQSGMVGEVVS